MKPPSEATGSNMDNSRLVIVDGVRTPFSKMGTTLAGLGADELGRVSVSNLLARTGKTSKYMQQTCQLC